MTPLFVGYIGTIILVVLLFSGMPIGITMTLVGFVGMWLLAGTKAGLVLLATIPFHTMADYGLAVIPLFMLMGQFAVYSGIAKDLYETAYKWLGQFRGGLSMATIGACAGFSAITGSSVATALTFGTVALPEMQRYRYAPSLATATCASGGTLGILIPPSITLIMYGILTENSVGKLFIAGVFPGLLLAALFMLTVYAITRIDPAAGPPGAKTSLKEKLVALRLTWVVLVLFILVIGGIFAGWFTPTEAAAIGASGSLIIGLIRRKLNWRNFVTSLVDTGRLAAMAFTILIGAFIFGYFITISGLPQSLATFFETLSVDRYIIMIGIIILYIILGCMMDAMAMIVLTIPFIYPIVINLGFDPIWFGIIIVVMCEMGLITPPVGMNLFMLSGVSGIDLVTIIKGVWPFVLAMIVCTAILLLFPQITLLLPGFMTY